MDTFLCQDWTTIRGSGTTPIIQSKPAWLDAAGYADATFWLEVREVTNPGAGVVILAYESSPTADETLFEAISFVPGLAPTTTPTVRKVFLYASAIPMARFVRWSLIPSTSGTWDVTFRIFVTLGFGSVGGFSPLSVPSLCGWYEGDTGYGAGTWNDRSNRGNHLTLSGTGAGSPLSGHATVNFASGEFAQRVGFPKGGAGAISLFVVAQPTAAPASRIVDYSDGLFDGHGLAVDGSGHATVTTAIGPVSGTSNVVGNWHRIAMTDASGGTQHLYVDGAHEATQASVGAVADNLTLALGRVVTGVATYTGDIAEVLVFATEADADLRANVDAYFVAKYGL